MDCLCHKFLGVMAALSPQQDWYMNYDIGVRVIDTFANAQNEVFSPEMEAVMQRFMDNPANARQRPLDQARLDAMRGKRLAELDSIEAAYFIRFYDEANNPNGAKYRYIFCRKVNCWNLQPVKTENLQAYA